MQRRDLFKLPLAAVALISAPPSRAAACESDGTPLQFIPKKPADSRPLDDELKKYPKCPYCGMDRREYHHARHLVQYGDDLVDGVCSIHCLALSLAINLDRGPKAIYAADNASGADIKPLVNVDMTTYLIGGSQKGVMTQRSKVAYASTEAAQAAKEKFGGALGDFSAALGASYEDMARDTLIIRKRREERRLKMQQKPS
jgi:copper chaperone NosL